MARRLVVPGFAIKLVARAAFAGAGWLTLIAAVAGVVLCRLAKLPPMLGYLVVGVLIGLAVLTILASWAFMQVMFLIVCAAEFSKESHCI